MIGPHGSGNWAIDNGELLIQLCTLNRLCIGNTYFKHKYIHKKSWHSPDGTNPNETDYFCISKNWGLSIQDVHIFWGVDFGNGYSFLGGKVRIKFKKITKKPAGKPFDIRKLKDNSIEHNFCIKLLNRFQVLQDSQNLENKWVNFKTAVTKAAETDIWFRRGSWHEMWISATTLHLIDQRKKIKLQRNHAKTLTTVRTLDENYRATNRVVKWSYEGNKKNV